MSYGWFCARHGPGEREKSGLTSGTGQSRGTPVCPSRRQAALTTFEPRSTRLICAVARPAVLRLVAPAHRSFVSALARPRRASGAWGGTKIGRADGRSPSHHSPKPSHTSLKFLTRPPSTRSSYPHHLTLPQPCYSGPVKAPAFRERQTGAPRPGSKSSPGPPSVSRSTDRVTQDNGIDPKPFWRLRALPEEPHLIKLRPGRPSRGAPASATVFRYIGLEP